MIKLKQLIDETKVPTYKWSTPSGTPDDVIKVFHYLVGMIMKQNKDPQEYVKVWHNNEDTPNMWALINKTRSSDTLFYKVDERKWYSSLDKWYSNSGVNQFTPLNNEELKIAIQNWV